MSDLTRRGFLAATTLIAAGGAVAAITNAGTAPKESGLTTEGLLAGRPGFQPRSVMPLPYPSLPGFLSAEQLAEHHADYARSVGELQATEKGLHEGADGDRYGELRRAQVRIANDVLLHELYFGGLSPEKVAPPHHIEKHMSEHIGSFASWRADFTKCALAAKAWAVLVYDPYDDRWHNAVMDGDDDGVWIGANPLVVCDVGAHAFAKDHPSRADYVAEFLDHIDWAEVSKRYLAVDRM